MYPFDYDLSFRICSIDVDPVEICRELCMSPKWMWKIGEPRVTPKGDLLEGKYENSYCTFVIDKNDEELLEDALKRAVIDLERFKKLFLKIRQGGGRIEFFIGWYTSGNSGSTLDYSLLKCLAELQIDLALDVYGGP